MKDSALTRILLVLSSIVLGLLICELLLLLIWGKPSVDLTDQDFRERYIHIYDGFFKKTPSGYTTLRNGGKPVQFGVNKSENEKRVFILGESVAALYPEKNLENKLNAAFPGRGWKAINCGMHSYDSYRTALIAEELVRYKPDLFVLMMGNNDGAYSPAYIPKYRYPLIYRSRALSLIYEFIFPPVAYSDALFRKNLDKIITIAANNDVRLLVLTLPKNHKLPPIIEGSYYLNRESFEPMWLLWKKPLSVLKHYSGAKNKPWWLLAKAAELSGSPDKAIEFYKLNNLNHRNDIIRAQCAGKPDTALVDFEAALLERSGGAPGFEYFSDCNHYWPPVYGLISELAVNSYLKSGLAGGAEGITPALTPNESLVRDTALYFSENSLDRFLTLFPASLNYNAGPGEDSTEIIYFDGLKEFVKLCLRSNPGYFKALRANTGEYTTRTGTRFDLLFITLGGALREEHDHNGALYFLNLAQAAQNRNPLLYLLRGLCYYDLGHKEKANADFRTLNSLQPGYAWLTVHFLEALEK